MENNFESVVFVGKYKPFIYDKERIIYQLVKRDGAGNYKNDGSGSGAASGECDLNLNGNEFATWY